MGIFAFIARLRVARELAAKDGVKLDDDVLFAAAYLHDVAAFPPWADNKQDHADIVVTPAGRAMPPARKAELARFIESLKAQSEDLQDL